MTITTIPQADPTGVKTNVWREILDAAEAAAVFDLAGATLAAGGAGEGGGYEYELDSFEAPPDATDIDFSSDGTLLYFIGNANEEVNQHTLSPAWDITTAQDNLEFFDAAPQLGDAFGMRFSADETKMYLLSYLDNTIYQYTLSIAGDIESATYDTINFDTSAQFTDPWGFELSPDGTKLYIIRGLNSEIHQYTLPTPEDLTTVNYDGAGSVLDLSSEIVVAGGTRATTLTFNAAGTRLYVAGFVTGVSATIFEYIVPTVFDLDGASYNSISLDVYADITTPYGIYLKSDDTQLYILDNTNNTVKLYV